jgi:hypothetical protein
LYESFWCLLLCGFLLFLNFSSYLVQARLQSLSDRAEFVAQNAALDLRYGLRASGSSLTRSTRTASIYDQSPVRMARVKAGSRPSRRA